MSDEEAMMYKIEFNTLSAMAFDFVDHSDGFLYLRFVGDEATVNAMWALLSAKEYRGRKWSSPIKITRADGTIPEYVSCQKSVSYRTLRSRLPSGLIDVAMVHPVLTVAEDTERGFYLLTYEEGIPSAFFERLNRCLAIPLKPEWTDWLWELGQQNHSMQYLDTRQVNEGGKRVAKQEMVQSQETPIRPLRCLGTVLCYRVQTAHIAREAWLHLIRQSLQLGIRLYPQAADHYANGDWTISGFVRPEQSGWCLKQGDEVLLEAATRDNLLIEARQLLGYHFLLEEA